MKKIVAAFDGLKFSKSSMEYASLLAKKKGDHLVGVFLEDFTYHSYKIYELVDKEGISPEKLKAYEEKDAETRANAVKTFETACRNKKIDFSVRADPNIAIRELLRETIYCDLLVIDAHETLTHYNEPAPSRFMKDLLSETQSPVFVVPSEFKPIEKYILLYDGGPTSVYAIKMFDYLFSGLKDVPIEVLHIREGEQPLFEADKKLIKEFLKQHFPESKFTVLKGPAETAIISHLKKIKENALVVLGAYRRGTVSRWFRESMADTLLQNLNLPLFIAHNK